MNSPITDDPFASVWDEASLALQRRLLRRVTEIAASIGVKLFLDWGTLLGHVRQGGILPWDDDLDLALYDGGRALELGAAIAASGLQWGFTGNGETLMKVFDPAYPHRRDGWTWPFIDIFVFQPQGDALVGSLPTLSLPRDIVLPGRPMAFEGAVCWEPERSLALLDTMYPGWRIQEVTTVLNHRDNRYTDGATVRRIGTDARGRKIDQGPVVMRVAKWAHSRRPCLVVVRASGQAHYRTWMQRGAFRTWDLLVNFPGEQAFDDGVANHIAIGGAGKYAAARDLYYADARLLRERKAVLLLDDDVDIAFEDLDRLFRTFLTCDLWLAQPSWAPGSPAGTALTLTDARFEVHYTDLVDGAAALFSQSALAACVESFEQEADDGALGSLWPRLLQAPFDRVGVIDAVAVRQTANTDRRPRADGGGQVLGYIKRAGDVLQKFKTS